MVKGDPGKIAPWTVKPGDWETDLQKVING
jgi:hypothetical protein